MNEVTENLNFGQALAALQLGKAVTRAVWQGYWLLEEARFQESNTPTLRLPLAHTKWGSIEPAQPYWTDMLATDWRVLSDEEFSLVKQRLYVLGSKKEIRYVNPHNVEEAEAAQGLDIRGYSGKWGKAKLYATALFPDGKSANYWDAARLHFLELGGERTKVSIFHPTWPANGQRYGGVDPIKTPNDLSRPMQLQNEPERDSLRNPYHDIVMRDAQNESYSHNS